ncbi:uncharacterized protein LOC132797889 [Drosophila nasuta]|uniref:uncharacterized protein LOC132797889 n=1 Tax=Drosophila nasuta TaxID=42062 RepID=UPI00295F02EF|nr:uncharacterized protein LOC132797889 [Drosophila nasuta]
MIKGILQINEYVTLTLLKLRNGPSPITTEELEVLDDLSDLLSPFQEAILSVSTNTKVSVSLIIPVIAEIHHKMNQLNAKLRTQEGKDIYDLVKKRLVERLDTFETRTIPRIATLVDPRFKKDGFLRPSNADQAAKALELELLSFKSTTPRRPPTPPEPTSNELNFRFSFLQNKSKVKTTRADAIITTRHFMEKENAPDTCDWEMTDDNDHRPVSLKGCSAKLDKLYLIAELDLNLKLLINFFSSTKIDA